MLTEDYISFETSKLLKEKGYKGSFDGYYNDAGCVVDRPNALLKEPEYHYYGRVSLYMAMKWLREVHHYIIEIHYGNVGSPREPKMQWWWELENIQGEFLDGNITDGNATYEEAVEAAINHALEYELPPVNK